MTWEHAVSSIKILNFVKQRCFKLQKKLQIWEEGISERGNEREKERDTEGKKTGISSPTLTDFQYEKGKHINSRGDYISH